MSLSLFFPFHFTVIVSVNKQDLRGVQIAVSTTTPVTDAPGALPPPPQITDFCSSNMTKRSRMSNRFRRSQHASWLILRSSVHLFRPPLVFCQVFSLRRSHLSGCYLPPRSRAGCRFLGGGGRSVVAVVAAASRWLPVEMKCVCLLLMSPLPSALRRAEEACVDTGLVEIILAEAGTEGDDDLSPMRPRPAAIAPPFADARQPVGLFPPASLNCV